MRTDGVIRDEYEKSWKNSQISLAHVNTLKKKRFLLRDQPVVSSPMQYIQAYIGRIHQEMVNSESVLELGSGNGLNLLLLAILNPQIKLLRGVELTCAGVQMAERFVASPPIKELAHITDLPDDTIVQRLRGRDFQFLVGDMRALPFEAETFDCVFSRQAIEQMPRDYPQVFDEAFRVVKSGGAGIFLEEFRESQNIFNLMYLKIHDFFRVSCAVVEKAGFNIEKFETMPLSNLKYHIGALVVKKPSAKDPVLP